jgi:hypothetical protein
VIDPFDAIGQSASWQTRTTSQKRSAAKCSAQLAAYTAQELAAYTAQDNCVDQGILLAALVSAAVQVHTNLKLQTNLKLPSMQQLLCV